MTHEGQPVLRILGVSKNMSFKAKHTSHAIAPSSRLGLGKISKTATTYIRQRMKYCNRANFSGNIFFIACNDA